MISTDYSTEFRELQGYLGYRVGNDGSLWTKRMTGPNKGSVRFSDEWRLMPTSIEYTKATETRAEKKYRRVCLKSNDGREVHRFVHVLICETFHGSRPHGYFATHNNGNSLDNSAENLSWKTPKGNTQDAITHGTLRIGERHNMAKLNNRLVADALARYMNGEGVHAIASSLGVTDRAVDFILKGEHWRDVPRPEGFADYYRSRINCT